MNRMIWMMSFLVSLMLVQTGIAGEYYQYTDKDGNVIFTDDITKVPQENQSEMKTYESIVSKPQPPVDMQTEDASGMDEYESSSPDDTMPAEEADDYLEEESGVSEPDNEPLDKSDYKTMTEQFEREKELLDQKLAQLEKERQQLMDQDVDSMSSSELTAYNEQIRDVNDRIQKLKQEQAQFMKKVGDFNARLRAKQMEKMKE